MHRSGTSLVASLVSALSVDLGQRLLPPDEHNPAGYFQDVEFLDFQRKLLASCCAPDDGGHPDWGWTEHERLDREGFGRFVAQAHTHLASRAELGTAWGWKDPRTTLLLDFWDAIADGARYVFVYRSPWEVADSIQRLGSDVFLQHPDYAYRIWSFYNTQLRDFYVKHADRSVLVSVAALPKQLEPFLRLLTDKLGLPPGDVKRARHIFRKTLLKTTPSPHPVIDLAATAWPDAMRLLAELDAIADLSGETLTYARPATTRLSRPDVPSGRPIDVSVVIPTYDQSMLLLEAVASIERHTPENTELIIVNDGSREGRTLQILDRLRQIGYFVVDQENGGLAAARNRGIALARGRYVLPLDDDNRIAAGFVDEAIRVLDSMPEVGVVYGDREDFGLRTGLQHVADFNLAALLKANYIDACAVFRRRIWSDCGGYDAAMSPMEDWELWLHAAERGWRFHHIPRKTFEYRVRPGSLITKVSTMDDFEQLRDRIRDKHPEVFAAPEGVRERPATAAADQRTSEPKRTVASLQARVNEQLSAIRTLTDRLRHANEAAERLSAVVTSREQATTWLWTELKTAQQALAERRRTIESLATEAEERLRRIAAFKAELARRTELEAHLREMLEAERRAKRDLATELEVRDQAIRERDEYIGLIRQERETYAAEVEEQIGLMRKGHEDYTAEVEEQIALMRREREDYGAEVEEQIALMRREREDYGAEVEEQVGLMRREREDYGVEVEERIGLMGKERENYAAEVEARMGLMRKEREDYGAEVDRTFLEHQTAHAAKDAHIQNLSSQLELRSKELDIRNAQLAEIFSSTSWKVGKPVRVVGLRVRKLRALTRQLREAGRDPATLSETMSKLFRLWRSGGMPQVKNAIATKSASADAQAATVQSDAWREYRERFEQHVTPGIVRRVREMGVRPLISVILPTYNTPESMLRETLSSVQRQLYFNWELCIADDGSTEPHVAKTLKACAAADPRVKVDLAAENRGVSHASNRALAMATGEFVVLLDHDDVLEEQALFRVAECMLADQPDMLYSDEVLVTEDRSAIKQYVFRPAFSPEFLRGHPYIVHLVGFRTKLVRELGGFDETLRISQDYDLILRASEKAKTITHIPEVLYQWRVHGSSAGHEKMQEVMATSKSVLQRHLERCGESGIVIDGAGFNLFDTRYALTGGLKVAIIIPTRNLGTLLRQCIDSIRATVLDVDYRLVVVDHGSDEEETLAYLSAIAAEDVAVLRYERAFNFSAINNWAVSRSADGYSHYLFCNNDVQAIAPGWLERMLERAQQPSIGIVGAKLLYPDRHTIQHAGVLVGAFGRAEHYAKFLQLPVDRLEPGYMGALVLNHEVAAVTGACLLIRKDAFEQVAGFDEALAVGFGDVDLCLRAGRYGYRTVFCPHAELVHHESSTRGTGDLHPEDTALFQTKWRHLFEAGDPYYNPGLSLDSTQYEVRYPLRCDLDVPRRTIRRDVSPGPRGSETVATSDRSAPALAQSDGRGGAERSTVTGPSAIELFKSYSDLKPDERVLDVGCGDGRVAIALTEYLTSGQYVGFDVVRPRIEGCQRTIALHHPHFTFFAADVYNRVYNPQGSQPAAEYTFPLDDNSFDFVVVMSVFTHLVPEERSRYASEIARVLRAGGRCFCTAFVTTDEARKDLDSGAIAYPQDQLAALLTGNGLDIVRVIESGWDATECARDVVIACKPSAVITTIEPHDERRDHVVETTVPAVLSPAANTIEFLAPGPRGLETVETSERAAPALTQSDVISDEESKPLDSSASVRAFQASGEDDWTDTPDKPEAAIAYPQEQRAAFFNEGGLDIAPVVESGWDTNERGRDVVIAGKPSAVGTTIGDDERQDHVSTTVPTPAVKTLDFLCNVCGHENRAVPVDLAQNREFPSCATCKSTLRMRSLIYALSIELYGRPAILPDFPVDKSITGLGLSDWRGYSWALGDKFLYDNKFYHAEPRLDITDIPDDAIGRYHFVISSDVFEHIPCGRLDRAFRNSRRLLEETGVCILTVPFKKTGHTQEHFPRLHDFRLVETNGKRYLYNKTSDGDEEVFDQLIFHGGPGMTLEMRMFSESDLRRRFEEAGFSWIRICAEDAPEFGIIWPMNWAVPIVARP